MLQISISVGHSNSVSLWFSRPWYFPRIVYWWSMWIVDPVKRRRNINSGRYFCFGDLTSDIFFSGPALEFQEIFFWSGRYLHKSGKHFWKFRKYFASHFLHLTYSFFSGPVLEILNSSLGFVYSVGSYLSIECMYRSESKIRIIEICKCFLGKNEKYIFDERRVQWSKCVFKKSNSFEL